MWLRDKTPLILIEIRLDIQLRELVGIVASQYLFTSTIWARNVCLITLKSFHYLLSSLLDNFMSTSSSCTYFNDSKYAQNLSDIFLKNKFSYMLFLIGLTHVSYIFGHWPHRKFWHDGPYNNEC